MACLITARPDPGVVQQHGALYAGALADPHPRREHRLADPAAGYVRAAADQAPGPAVVLVKGRGRRIVAIPESLSPDEVVELASLVLPGSEYEEFRRAVEAHRPPRNA